MVSSRLSSVTPKYTGRSKLTFLCELDHKFAIAASAIALLFSSVPLFAASMLAKPGEVFLWIHNHDVLQYWAFIHQAADGFILFNNPFSPLHNNRVYFSTYFTILGLFYRILPINIAIIYYISYILCAAFLLRQLYNCCTLFCSSRQRAVIAYVVLLGSAGVGWLVVFAWMIVRRDWTFLLNPRFPVVGTGGLAQDVSGNGMHVVTLLTSPLNTLAVGLFVLGLSSTYRIVSGQTRLRDYLYANAVAVLLPLTHPYTGLAYVVTLGLYAAYQAVVMLVDYVDLQRHTLYFGISSPLILGLTALSAPVLALGADPVVRSIASFRYTVPFVYFGLALMPSILFMPVGVGELLKSTRKKPGNVLLVVWAVAGFLCMQNGLIIPWRFTHVAFAPVVLLGIIGVFALQDIVRKPMARCIVRWMPAVLFVVPLPSLMLWALTQATITTAPSLVDAELTYFVTRDEAAAFDWLRSRYHAGTEVVLASMPSGAPIAGMTGLRVVTGHNSLEVNAAEKRKQVRAFFEDPFSDSAREFLKEYHVDLVFYGPRERAIRWTDMRSVPYLDEIFSNDSVSIYLVMRDRLGSM